MNWGDPRLPDRFWNKVQPEPNSGCWLWTASTTGGYGMFGLSKGTIRRAHIIAYITLVGDVPAGLQLDHLCRTRECCNPLHLEPVTQRENLIRGNGFAGRAARVTHCPKGHPYDEKNTRWYKNQHGYESRGCRECNRLNCSRWYANKRTEAK